VIIPYLEHKTNSTIMDKQGVDDFGHEYLSLNGFPTEVMTFGPNLFELSKLEKEQLPKTIILMIPGNPGVIKYYEEFMRCIFNAFEGRCPVWGISHGGHSKGPPTNNTLVSGNVSLDNLEGQINHKKFFINDFIPGSVRLVLIGHSIGAYMTLELLKLLPNDRITKAILLFPTIERMAISPNGKWTTPLVTYVPFIPTFFAYLSLCLPEDFRLKLIRWYFRRLSIPQCISEATLHFFQPSVVKSSIRLAKDEMDKVVDINSASILANQDKIIMYYGAKDGWCPVSYYLDTKNRFPGIDARLCENGFEHAFVLESSREMADQVSDWLREKIVLK